MNNARRTFIRYGAGAFAAASLLSRFAAANSPPGSPALVTIENFSPAGKSLGTAQVPKIVKTDAEWRAQLSPLSFQVARQAGTETAFSGEYDKNRANGIYQCICCATAQFDSNTKFDSGTGWPSFYRAISRYNVAQSADNKFGMLREAISCRRCDAHLGHVFDDGPRPTGLRYCMNSVSLHFVPRSP